MAPVLLLVTKNVDDADHDMTAHMKPTSSRIAAKPRLSGGALPSAADSNPGAATRRAIAAAARDPALSLHME